jgi:hypothetical protein
MVLVVGVAAWLVMLVAFLVLQSRGARFLDLHDRWLVVAAVPIVVALVAGGYIRKFKGFGIELEARLRKSVQQRVVQRLLPLDSRTADVMTSDGAMTKGGVDVLERMSPEERQAVGRLSFVDGRGAYYAAGAVRMYLERLPNVRYFDVQSSEGKFVSLTSMQGINARTVEEFIGSLETRSVPVVFRQWTATEAVREDQPLVEVLPRLQSAETDFLPAVDSSGRLTGVIEKETVADRIIKDVVEARD